MIVDKEKELSTLTTSRNNLPGEEALDVINEITELETSLSTCMGKVKVLEDKNNKLRELITQCKATENAFESNVQLILQMSFLLQNQTGKNPFSNTHTTFNQ